MQHRIGQAWIAAVLLLPAAVLLALSLASGGFFPDSVSLAAVAVIVIFVVRAVATPTSFSGLGNGARLTTVALVALATLTLISGSWSGSAARATFDYDRALLYAAVFVVTSVLGRSAKHARILTYGLLVVSVGISIAATATWLLPHLFPVDTDIGRARLSWPTSYWNATGLIAALALVWTTSLSCSVHQPPWVRVLCAGVTPAPVAALIFTVSRGAIAVAVLGLVLAVAVIRSPATPGGLASVVPAVVLTVLLALHTSGLSVSSPTAHAVSLGQRTAVLLIALSFGATALRTVLLRLDARISRARIPWTQGQVRRGLGVAVAILVVAFAAFGGPSAVSTAVHRFVAPENQSVGSALPAAQRLTRLGNNGRIDEWRVAIDDGFLRHPVFGTGSGTYATLWTRYGPTFRRVLNAHSLYLEELSELGIVGGALLIGIVVGIIAALARRARGPERELWAPLLAGGVAWAVHAGVDWDWQMPAITAWFFAAGGLALAVPRGQPRRQTAPLLRFAVGCLLLTITPITVWRSQTEIVKAVEAFERGDCLGAERAALASNAAVSSRWEPFEIISYCEAGAGKLALARNAIIAAEARDPENWELRYSESLVDATAGVDPRPAAAAALARYPRSILARAAAHDFSRGGPRAWRRFALSASLPLPGSTR